MILIAVLGCLLFCEIKLSVDIFPALSKAPGNELFCHKPQRDIIYSGSCFMKTITKPFQREGYFMTKWSN
ncbi:TPA: hypothetical protein ACT19U_002404, partial [Raoultella ornithinolytica]